MTLVEEVNVVQSRHDFANFVDILVNDLQNDQTNWENASLDRYLGALSAWVRDMDGYYLNRGENLPESTDWKIFAQILLAAKYYE